MTGKRSIQHSNNDDNNNNNNENQPVRTNPLIRQHTSLRLKSIQDKWIRQGRLLPKWRRTATNRTHSRSRFPSKALIAVGDSLIQLNKRLCHSSTGPRLNRPISEKIKINISGKRYETYLSTFENYPNTLLGNKQRRLAYWDDKEEEYFFDRHRLCFEAILYYYQSNGRLRRPDHVPLDTFLEEVSFFDLGPQAVAEIERIENVSIVQYIDLPSLFWRRYIWFYLEFPRHSRVSRILNLISMLLTVVSCIALAIETLPQYNKQYDGLCQQTVNDTTLPYNISSCLSLSSPFFIIQTMCVSYFTIEFMLRLISTPSYYRFIISIYSWIDLGTIVPYFLILGLELTHRNVLYNNGLMSTLRVFRVLRFVRLLKVYLIFSQLKSLRVLNTTLKESFKDFLVMIAILTVLGFMFGAGTYFAEESDNGAVFDSIPKATYWGIITISSVGYGDIYPTTIAGRIMACACGLCGVITSGILVSVLVDRYQRVYNRKMFYPEQIISPVDPSENEHDEKQDFINKNLSEPKRLKRPSNASSSSSPVASIHSSSNHKGTLRQNNSSKQIRFVISFSNKNVKEKSTEEIVNELFTELKQAIRDSNEQVIFKLISQQTNPSSRRISTRVNASNHFEERTI